MIRTTERNESDVDILLGGRDSTEGRYQKESSGKAVGGLGYNLCVPVCLSVCPIPVPTPVREGAGSLTGRANTEP